MPIHTSHFCPERKKDEKQNTAVEADIKFAMSRGVREKGNGAKECEVTDTVQI